MTTYLLTVYGQYATPVYKIQVSTFTRTVETPFEYITGTDTNGSTYYIVLGSHMTVTVADITNTTVIGG